MSVYMPLEPGGAQAKNELFNAPGMVYFGTVDGNNRPAGLGTAYYYRLGGKALREARARGENGFGPVQYHGLWEDGRRSGEGSLYARDGTLLVKDGFWLDDVLSEEDCPHADRTVYLTDRGRAAVKLCRLCGKQFGERVVLSPGLHPGLRLDTRHCRRVELPLR